MLSFLKCPGFEKLKFVLFIDCGILRSCYVVRFHLKYLPNKRNTFRLQFFFGTFVGSSIKLMVSTRLPVSTATSECFYGEMRIFLSIYGRKISLI